MGKFEFFTTGTKFAESENRIIYDGQEAIMDTMFGLDQWYSGGFKPMIAVGVNGDDNSYYFSGASLMTGELNEQGIPTGFKDGTISITGDNGLSYLPNLEDSWMTSIDIGNNDTGLFWKEADRFTRVGRQLIAEAKFKVSNDSADIDSDVILTGTELREMGIFFGGEPTTKITPSTNPDQRDSGMIARSVRYEISGDYIQDNPIVVPETDITVRYSFSG